MPRTLLRALLIVVIGSALGVAANAIRWDKAKDGTPRRLAWVTPPKTQPAPKDAISLADAKAAWDTGAAIFLDARALADYSAGHIATALNLPAENFDGAYPKIAPLLAPDSTIVCYCDGVECELSHRLLELLRQQGHTNVHLIINGWTEWRKAGLPTTTGDQP